MLYATPDAAMPAYHLTIDSTSLQQLDANPWQNLYVPARIAIKGKTYPCQVRYRGGSTRGVPKKSWRVKFEDDDNPFHATHINLTSQYIDPSFMRNVLAVRLYEFLDTPTPSNQYIQFFVNGVSHGLYVEVEDINEYFFRKRGIAVGEVFKGNSHGARFTPLLRQEDYPIAWEKKLGQADTYTSIQLLSSALAYLPEKDFEKFVQQQFNVSHVLQYFAVEFILVAHDNITKNFYLYFDAETQRYSIIPWDNDASMGNDWQGIYHDDSYTLRYTQSLFKVQLLFQRMMKIPTFRQQFVSCVHNIIGNGFAHITSKIDSIATYIRPVVYSDTLKRDSNDDFERSIGEIKTFLTQREEFLEHNTNYKFIHPSAMSCSRAFAATDSTVMFQATARPYTSIVVEIAHDVNFDKREEKGETKNLLLFDDGHHNDGKANDGIYANTFIVPTQKSPIMPYVFSTYYGTYPESGLVDIEHQPSVSPALIVTSATIQDYQQLHMTGAYALHNDIAIALVNTSSQVLDLSFSLLCAQARELRFPFPPGTRIAPGDTLVVTSNPALARSVFPSATTVGNIYYPVALGDTLALLSPNNELIASYPVQTIATLSVPEQQVIITEIQYAPADIMASGEWIELWNPTERAINMEGWYIQDADETHSFPLPASAILPPNGYLIVCSDTAQFAHHYPDVVQRVGNMDFHLGSTESIYLYDAANRPIDRITYTNHTPWPAKIEGFSLSLCDPLADNSQPKYWQHSASIGGTPGIPNPDCHNSNNIPPLVINEINYRSSSQFNAGDWVELYNPTTQKVDVSHWVLADEKDDNTFVFPLGTTILPHGYLVVYRKGEQFTRTHPSVAPSSLVGPMDFGLKSEHGEVRLFTADHQLVDSVAYQSDSPWPTLSENGETLELRCPTLNNTVPQYWSASSLLGGTPAARNSINTDNCSPQPPVGARVTVFPNPVADILAISIDTEQEGILTVELFDVIGKHIATLYNSPIVGDTLKISWPTAILRSGVYTVVVQRDNTVLSTHSIIHFK